MRSVQELVQATQEFAKEDPKKSWIALLSTLLLWALVIVGTALPIAWPIRAFCSVASGLLIVRIFVIYHDYLHGAIFRDSKIIKFIMWPFGILILNPPNVWKRSHNYHHQNNSQMGTSSIGSFPVMTTTQYESASSMQRIQYRIARNPLTICFAYFTIFIVGMCLKSFLKDPKRHWDSLVALIVQFSLVAVFAWAGLDYLFLTLVFPLFLACALGAYLFYIQHNFPGVALKPRAEWDYVYAAMRSSSFMEAGPLLHWLTGNIGYHHVHHLNARIPFYRLPEAMKAIPELHSPAKTSLRPLDILHCFQLKLWNPAEQRMVGF